MVPGLYSRVVACCSWNLVQLCLVVFAFVRIYPLHARRDTHTHTHTSTCTFTFTYINLHCTCSHGMLHNVAASNSQHMSASVAYVVSGSTLDRYRCLGGLASLRIPPHLHHIVFARWSGLCAPQWVSIFWSTNGVRIIAHIVLWLIDLHSQLNTSNLQHVMLYVAYVAGTQFVDNSCEHLGQLHVL